MLFTVTPGGDLQASDFLVGTPAGGGAQVPFPSSIDAGARMSVSVLYELAEDQGEP
jgi:hypothetical protein